CPSTTSIKRPSLRISSIRGASNWFPKTRRSSSFIPAKIHPKIRIPPGRNASCPKGCGLVDQGGRPTPVRMQKPGLERDGPPRHIPGKGHSQEAHQGGGNLVGMELSGFPQLAQGPDLVS